MATALLFPGQGAQHVGMGQDSYAALAGTRRVLDQAEAIIALPLKKLCFEGPEDQLARTDIAQPAIFAVSMALLTDMGNLLTPDKLPQPCCCAGLSLGEYTALCAAGAISFEDALKLVAKRGQYMQEAATAVPSGMVSLMGADEEIANKVCDAARGQGVLVPANFNCPGQIVISGSVESCKKALEVAAQCGASGAVELKVAGAFHSPLMKPAADRLAEALAKTEIRQPKFPVISNVTAKPHGGPEEIRKLLLEQLTSPVRWQQCCEFMRANGASEFLEIGPGRVLAGLMRRIDRQAKVTSLNGREPLEKYAGAAS